MKIMPELMFTQMAKSKISIWLTIWHQQSDEEQRL